MVEEIFSSEDGGIAEVAILAVVAGRRLEGCVSLGTSGTSRTSRWSSGVCAA